MPTREETPRTTDDQQRTPQRIVVVGSGFAGFEAARGLSRRLRRASVDAEIVLISPDDYMLYTPLLPEVAGGLLDPRYVAVPLPNALPDVHLRPGRVVSANLDAHTLQLREAIAGTSEMHWDRLVLTPGSVTRLFDVPGLADHAHGLKNVAEALYLREHFLREIELADHDPDEARRTARRTAVVVGASYAGTELVAQLRALADSYAAARDRDVGDYRFVLLDAADRVMPEVGDKLSDRVLQHLRSRDIDVHLGCSLEQVTEDSARMTDGTTVPTHTIAWLTGVTAAPLVGNLGLPMTKGRLDVETDLSLPGHPDVFAAGDAAAVPDVTQSGQITPPTAQHATRQGRVVARNVAASLGVGTRIDYEHRNLGLVVDLGPGFAVANPLGIPLAGHPAKAVTRAYHLAALPHAPNRWATGLAYLRDTVAKRPMSLLGLVSSEAASFRSSEDIAHQDSV